MSDVVKRGQAVDLQSEVALSTRVRLARNLTTFPFPASITTEQAAELTLAVERVSIDSSEAILRKMKFRSMKQFLPLDRLALVEKHLISRELAKNNRGAVGIGEGESVAIMVNEEDHLRIQCLLPGLQIAAAWQIANRIDDALEAGLPYAFHNELGYLTACPTKVGTGMRASVMLHLPGLVL
ncbi:MAG: ATP--guanido phosphotransferase, partial [bacterium]|nr:ATP--guanido phosphotransferase [bacterium]